MTALREFDPLQDLLDPFAAYAVARGEQPAFFSEQYGQWFVTRYRDIREILNDTTRFSSNFFIRTPYVMGEGVAEVLARGVPETPVLLNQDPPDHARTPIRLQYPTTLAMRENPLTHPCTERQSAAGGAFVACK